MGKPTSASKGSHNIRVAQVTTRGYKMDLGFRVPGYSSTLLQALLGGRQFGVLAQGALALFGTGA